LTEFVSFLLKFTLEPSGQQIYTGPQLSTISIGISESFYCAKRNLYKVHVITLYVYKYTTNEKKEKLEIRGKAQREAARCV